MAHKGKMGHSSAKLMQRQPGQSTEFGHAKRSGKVETPFMHAAAHKSKGGKRKMGKKRY